MRKGKGAEEIVINLDIFTKSAKPEITGDVKLSTGSPGEPITIDILLSLPENEVTQKIEISCVGPVKSIEKYIVVPETKEFKHRMSLEPTFSDTDEHELKVILKHGVYYTSILPEMLKTFSYTPPDISIKGVEANNYRVIPGKPAEMNIILEASGKESSVDIWGNIFDVNGKKLHHFDKKRVTFSGEHTETFLANISDIEEKGEMGVEIFLCHYSVKTSKCFENVFFIASKYDISLSMLDISPRSILPGGMLTVTAGISNTGIEILDLSTRLHFRKNDNDICSIPLGKITLEPNSAREIVPKEYQFLVEDTQELLQGSYELFFEISGDVEATEKGAIEVTGGMDIEFFGATTDKYSYCPGESVHLIALYKTGGRLIDEKFTARITAETIKGKGVGTSVEVLDVNREEAQERGEVEWVIRLDDKMPSGYVNVSFEIYIDLEKTPLSVFRLPYMFLIKGARQFSVKLEKEIIPKKIASGLSADLKREIGNYLFYGEKVAEAVNEKDFTTLKLNNGTYLNLHLGKVLIEPDEMNKLNSTVLARTAANMGFDRNYLEEHAKNISRVTFLVESIISSYMEDTSSLQALGKNGPELETPGRYTSNLIKGYTRALKKRVESMPKGKKRLVFAKKAKSDAFVMDNLVKRIMKNCKIGDGDSSNLIEHFAPYDDRIKKSNRSVKNTEMATERIKQLDLDYTSFFNKDMDFFIRQLDSGILKDKILEKMESGGPEYVPDYKKIYPMVFGLMSVYFMNKVSRGIRDFSLPGKMKPEGLAAHIYNFNMAYLHLYLFFSTLGRVMRSQENRLEKACKWLRDGFRNNINNHTRILNETLRFLGDYKKNMKVRKTVAEFRKNIQLDLDYDQAEGAEGTLLEIPVTANCDAKKDVLVDFTVILPGKEYRVHWPSSKAYGEINIIEGFRLEPGKNDIPIRIELPSSLPEQLPEITILAHPKSGNLITRENTAAFGSPGGKVKKGTMKSPGEKDEIISDIKIKKYPSKDVRRNLPDRTIIKHITDAMIRPGRYADLYKESMGKKVEKELLLEDIAKDLGMHKRKLYDILKDSDVYRLSEVAVKGGFLKMRNVVSHNIRFTTSREIHEILMERPLGLLAEASNHPVTAARVLSVYMKLLLEMPGVKKSNSEKRVVIPERSPAGKASTGSNDNRTDHMEQQWRLAVSSTISVKEILRQFAEKKSEIILPGKRSVNTFKGLVMMLVEMEPKYVKKFVSDTDLDSFFDNTIPGKVISSACISTRSKVLLSDLYDHDIKWFLLQRIARSPLKECVFEHITKPNLDNLMYQSRGEAEVTLSRLKHIANSYTAPALANVLFTVPKGTRPIVLKVLGEMKDERVVPSLVKMLKSSVEMEDRRAALKALISIGTPEALDQVEPVILGDLELESLAEEVGFRATEMVPQGDGHIILD
ncbi:MAG: HEAT repeat domain-containing protein [Candidatus Thermoplasmatota archaeon]|nr:HEAT repeat domain-containing protein [Candidatus Thermoplasmatota archaeon]